MANYIGMTTSLEVNLRPAEAGFIFCHYDVR